MNYHPRITFSCLSAAAPYAAESAAAAYRVADAADNAAESTAAATEAASYGDPYATSAAEAAAYAADNAAYAAKAADPVRDLARDSYLIQSAELAVRVLQEMDAPRCQLLEIAK